MLLAVPLAAEHQLQRRFQTQTGLYSLAKPQGLEKSQDESLRASTLRVSFSLSLSLSWGAVLRTPGCGCQAAGATSPLLALDFQLEALPRLPLLHVKPGPG